MLTLNIAILDRYELDFKSKKIMLVGVITGAMMSRSSAKAAAFCNTHCYTTPTSLQMYVLTEQMLQLHAMIS